MKSPLRRLRGFGIHHQKERKDRRPPPAKLDELVYAAQELEEIRNCYDSLLSAAAATTNSVYEFSEALEEMGTCLLKKTALTDDDDDDSGIVLVKLGKAQFELQKYVDSYRTNIIDTITTPSESLLKELQIVEEMKHQCDLKRDEYESMRAAYREKGRSRHSKIESFSSEQLQNSFAEHQEDAALLMFRLESLKQGQFRSLLTQAARHHAAQLSFFRRGLKYLEELDPHVKAVAEQQHIDYQFTGLEDDDSDNDDYDSYQDNHSDDGELSFDYEINDRDKDFLASRSSMDFDQGNQTTSPKPLKEHKPEDVKQIQPDSVTFRVKPETGSQSAPIFADNVLDPSERFRQMKPSSTRTFHSYKLPTPADDVISVSTGPSRSHCSDQSERRPHGAANLWHSSPLMKDFKPCAMYSGPIKMPSSSEGISAPLVYSYSTSDFKKMKREAFSGPIPSKVGLSKPLFSATNHRSSMDYPRVMSAKTHGPALQSSVSPKVSPRISPLPMTSPKISELHELPRPPANVESLRPSGLVGYSGPLVSKRQLPAVPTRVSPTASQTASPLPRPPAAMTRSYSIPSNSQRTPILTVNRLSEAWHSRESSDVSSPPLTPISLADVSQQSTAETTTGDTRSKDLVKRAALGAPVR